LPRMWKKWCGDSSPAASLALIPPLTDTSMSNVGIAGQRIQQMINGRVCYAAAFSRLRNRTNRRLVAEKHVLRPSKGRDRYKYPLCSGHPSGFANFGTMTVALVHDWLTGTRGGETCLQVFCQLFPHAEFHNAPYTL
jgi:hypothetical protein